MGDAIGVSPLCRPDDVGSPDGGDQRGGIPGGSPLRPRFCIAAQRIECDLEATEGFFSIVQREYFPSPSPPPPPPARCSSSFDDLVASRMLQDMLPFFSPPSFPLRTKFGVVCLEYSTLQNCESKPFSNPLEHTQKISSKSVQPFRRSSVTYTRTETSAFYSSGATVAERLDCSPPTKANRVNPRPVHFRIFSSGNRAVRCRWSAGFLGELPPPRPFIPAQPPYLPLFTVIGSQDSSLTPTRVFCNISSPGRQRSRVNLSAEMPWNVLLSPVLGSWRVGWLCDREGARKRDSAGMLVRFRRWQYFLFENLLFFHLGRIDSIGVPSVCAEKKPDPTSVQSMSLQSQCSIVLQAPSRTVGFTRRFHTLSSIHATNTSPAVVPQSPVVHTSVARAHSTSVLGRRLESSPTRVMRREGPRRQPLSSEYSCFAARPVETSSRQGAEQRNSPTAAVHYSRVSLKGAGQEATSVSARGRGAVRWVHCHSVGQQRSEICTLRATELLSSSPVKYLKK
ncbi:hypothetical protein PR048_031458 [Dryococelus australis]|uniref:Uncharacterized protein n=1 Tax=Dryococelus australis TaxID=614101 RepID=A0ABQ9G5B5_9NEOP|nr:hypothetical protein PR048_031458 [Dryococelus australis]